MNKLKRKQIEEISVRLTGLQEEVEELKSRVLEILSEEQDCYDSMLENLQGSEKGENSQETISNLDEAIIGVSEAVANLNIIY